MSAPTDFVRLQKGLENNSTARLVLFCISFYTNYQTGECWPSIATLAEESNLHPTTVRRQVHELAKLGFIKLQPRERSSSIITLVGYREWMERIPVRKAQVDTSTELVGGTSGALVGYSQSASRVLAERSEGTSGALEEIYNNKYININTYKKGSSSSTTDEVEVEDARVFFHNEQLKLCDQLNQFWLEQFDGQQADLNLALLQVSAYVQPNNKIHNLEKQVSSQLARIARERREKNARYNAAKASSSKQTYETQTKKGSYDKNAEKFWARVERGEIKL